METYKTCPHCGRRLPLTSFNRLTSNKYTQKCTDCIKSINENRKSKERFWECDIIARPDKIKITD